MDKLSVILNLFRISDNPETLILNYCVYRVKRLKSISTILHMKNEKRTKILIETPSPDAGLTCQIWGLDVYGAKEIKKGDVALDLGAHIGLFSLYAASKGAVVYAFEPNNNNFLRLTHNICLNGFETSIYPQKVALDTTAGTKELYLGKTSHAHSLIGDGSFEKVESDTLDNIIDRVMAKHKKIDFMKVDIETKEEEVVLGSKIEQLRKIKRMAIECENMDVVHHISSFLGGAGFEISSCGIKGYAHILYANRKD